MNRLKIVPWIIVLALALASCTNGDANPTDTTTAATSPASAAGYPYPGEAQTQVTVASVNSAYPGQDAGQATPTAVPTPLTLRSPASGKANIHGILTSGADKKPYKTFILLAATNGADKPGFPPMLNYSFDTSPRAAQDTTGLFVFYDVDPGQYGLVLASPIGGSPILDQSQNPPTDMIFSVAAGEDKDLGTINIP